MNNMETFWSTSHAAGAQSSYLESLYESYLESPSTKKFFELGLWRKSSSKR